MAGRPGATAIEIEIEIEIVANRKSFFIAFAPVVRAVSRRANSI
jgi:hypothetical protein